MYYVVRLTKDTQVHQYTMWMGQRDRADMIRKLERQAQREPGLTWTMTQMPKPEPVL